MGADDDRAAVGVGQLHHMAARLRELGEHGPGVLGERLSEHGGGDAPGPAFVERDAEDVLQLVQTAGGGGLGHVQLRGGADDASLPGERVDENQVAELQPHVEETRDLHATTLSTPAGGGSGRPGPYGTGCGPVRTPRGPP